MGSRLPDIPGAQKISPLGTVLKYGICVVILFLGGSFQASFFAASDVFPAAPDLALTLVAAISLIEGERCGAVLGIAAGIFAYALGGMGTAFLPVFYCLEGYILGTLGRTVFRRNLLSWTVYMLPLLGCRALLSFLFLLITEKNVPLGAVLLQIVLPEAGMTFLFSYLSYFVAWLSLRPFHRKRGKDDPVQLG